MRVNVLIFLRQAGCKCNAPKVFNRRAYIGCAECNSGYSCDRVGLPVPGPVAECHYCQRYVEGVTVDHIVPKALGGPDRARNYVPACGACNKRKAAKRSACECTKCVWAWEKWGPPDWAKLDTVDLH